MNDNRGRTAAWIVGAVVLGAPLRLVLDAAIGHEMVLLGAVNAVGWFLLGMASGRWGFRAAGVRAGFIAFGVAAFSSWASLAFHGFSTSGELLIAFIEVAFGLALGVIGHLVTMPRGPDL